ncbi:MAG: hypothetical protein EG822_18035 [Deltaproteobacteria bacterium]|nr:hypothetical protein [Deltaproteobacteria bacterium]TLN00917.1 MAG: hypothetical protein FDZ73_17825 [bacterium]
MYKIEGETISAKNHLILCGAAVDSLHESLSTLYPDSEDLKVCGAVAQGISEAIRCIDKIQALTSVEAA